MDTLLWPVRPTQRASSTQKRFVAIEIAVLWVLSLGLGFCFSFLFQRGISTILLVSSGIAGLGLLLFALPSAWYLDTFNVGLLSANFAVCLALVLVLSLSKSSLVEIYLYMSPNTPERSLFLAFFVAATLEEVLKLVAYIGPLILSERYRNVYHLTFLSVSAGCCFATIENLILAWAGPKIMLQRFIWCSLVHCSATVAGGLILAHIKTRYSLTEWRGFSMLPLVLLCPVALHGTYDFVIFYAVDVEKAWVGGMCYLVGALSVLIAMSLFYPFRRSRWNMNGSTTEKVCSEATDPDHNSIEI